MFLLSASVAVVATVAVIFLYRREIGHARAAATRGGTIVELDIGPIEYAERGAGAPLLSIHGAGGGYDQGLDNAAALVGEGYRIVAPSRFGYLRTPVPQNASSAAQADAHSALLSKLTIAKAVVLGASAGAASAVELALRHPERVAALILIVPALYSPTSPVSIEGSRGSKFAFWVVNVGGDFLWWAAEKLAPSMLIRFLGVRPNLLEAAPQADRDRVRSVVKSVEPLSLRFSGINLDGASRLTELPLETIAAPTLLVSARDDQFNTLPAAQFAAGKIPGAKLIVYESGGHLLVGHSQEVRAEVRAFLANAGSTPSTGAVAATVR